MTTTVEALLEKNKVSFIPSGRDYLVRCFNPDHEDKHPSMRVDKIQGVFHCLSCSYSGNIFSHYNVAPNGLQIKRDKLKQIIDNKLLESTGLQIPSDVIWMDKDWRGINSSTFKHFKAFEHESMSSRIIIPIYSVDEKIVVFQGRHTGLGVPKYLNYPRHKNLPWFPSRIKSENSSIILVEGLFDMLNLYDKGLQNAVCIFGVTKKNQKDLNIFKLQGITNVDLMLDNDTAGREASEEFKKFIEDNEMSYRMVDYSTNDPGELTADEVIQIKEKLYGS